ncbi:1,6-anhydro-N-acetylmuramyl-L-alanine amidase AmpD [Duodenibacillus massiliensis]|uniref:1,6-anhydro-N-acetylmuramyl-L-alanine amidase AmpD n=1 Tax=Duodenibacillus massiliensis TaxID=1852381 RepID=UPI0003351C44|nr:1 6-anhydro-N-acetylmuramyl-L-alanine amidase AmpD [Sutterella sp. CAG:397]
MADNKFAVDACGWSQSVVREPSDHFDARSGAQLPYLVVLHNISLPPGEFLTGCVADFFTDRLDFSIDPRLEDIRGVRVSSHYFIDRRGGVTQFVSCLERAWHAGVSTFEGKSRCNDFSVGIEIEGTDFTAFTESQYAALTELLAALAAAYPVRAVVAHSDIAPGRKTDPGPFFDWRRLWFKRAAFGAPAFPGAAALNSLGFSDI